MGESFADKLNDAFVENNLPEEVTGRFHILELLADNDLSDTYLLSCKKTGQRFVFKRFHHTELHSESELLSGLVHRGLPIFEPHIFNNGKLYTLRNFVDGLSAKVLTFPG